MQKLKKRILLSFFLSVLSLFFSYSSVLAALQADPIKQSPSNFKNSYQTDLFTGSASYTYPIKVPQGTNGLSPSVTLSYHSSLATDYVTHVGVGWELNRDYVERDVNFTPGNTGDDKFKLRFQGTYYDLVYVSSEGRYHTKTESNLHITKLTSGEENDNGEYWQIITPDGMKYRFGQATNSEQICHGRAYVYRWNLDLVTDVHNNKIFYTYSEDTNYGVSILDKIEYNSEKARVITFQYEGRINDMPGYFQGCDIGDPNNLTDIEIKANSNLVRKLTLAYDTSGLLLNSITEKGSDGTTALPETSFLYKPEVKSWGPTGELRINNQNLDVRLDQQDVAVEDVNGDGLADIVKTSYSGSNVWWKVLLNQGSTWSTSFQTWVDNSPINARLDQGFVRLVDVTGDSLPDIVKVESSGDVWKVFRNTGTSWNTSAETWANNTNFPDLEDPRVTIADVNGDSLADVIRSSESSTDNYTWEVFFNTGSSWNTTGEKWWDDVYWHTEILLGNSNVRLIDVNADSLPDIVNTVEDGGKSRWRVFRNTGTGWKDYAYVGLDANVNALLEHTDVTLADVNGDLLPDIVKSVNLGTADEWKVLKNEGEKWSTVWETWVGTGANMDVDSQGNNVRLIDVSGDRQPDLVKTTNSGTNVTWSVWLDNNRTSYFLSSIKTSQGGNISFDYASTSAVFDNTGADNISDLPFNVPVVTKMTVNNGMTGVHETNDVTTYTYKDGAYDSGDREFRGFETVETVEPNGTKKKYIFEQDDALKGLLMEEQTRDSQNNPYVETENTWSSNTTNGITTIKLDQIKNYTYDGTASNPKITQVDYLYDNYGNVIKQSDQGDTGTSGDERFTYFEYVYNTTAWIVDKVKHTYKHASDDSTKVSETWFKYDGHTGLNDAPTKGDLTKEEKWLDGMFSTNPVKEYEYDSYGNQIKITDANNNITEIGFGTNDTTHTYPDEVENAKDQITHTVYDLGTGNIHSKTDPNSFVTTYEYDVFGRITKEIEPYDSSSFPTVKYQYSMDGTAPEGTLISKREVSSSSATLDLYTYTDGIGRKIQTRSDAEDTSKQSVTNTFYDASGEVAKQTVPHLDTLSMSYVTPLTGIKTTEFTYDPLLRVTITKNPKGDTQTTSYDHWKETTIDENGHIKREYKNAFDKIVKVEEVDNGTNYTTTYIYNARDDLTKITDNGGNHFDFTYDSLSRKKSQTDSDMGTWEYTYDGVDNLLTKKDNRNITTTYTYDELNRIKKVDFPTNTDNVYTYDGNSKVGTLTSVTDAVGTVTYTYDNRLRKTQEQRTADGSTKTTQFSYDAADRLKTQTNPDGEVVTYAFNAQGETESVTGSSSLMSNIDYNAQGKITKKEYANGLSTDLTYNTNDFRLNRIQTGTVQDMSYTYDNAGNISTRTDNSLTKTETFTYDDLNRLKTASESAGGYNHAFQYNSIGNLTKATKNGVDTDYTYGQNAGVHAMTSTTEATTAWAPLLEDSWSSGSINGTTWSNWGNPQTSIANNELKITSTLSPNYYGINTSTGYDMTDAYVSAEMKNAGNQSISSWEAYPIYLEQSGNSNNALFFYVSNNTIYIQKKINNVDTYINAGSYNSSTHKYFRIKESNGNTYFDASTDGNTWTNLTSFATPFSVSSVTLGSAIGTSQTESSTTYATFDNFVYATTPASALSDDWASSISSTKWDDWGASQTNIVSNQLKMDSTNGAGYHGVQSNAGYDLTNSAITSELANAGNQSISSWEVYPIYLEQSGNPNNGVFFYITSNTIYIQKKVNNVDTYINAGAYNSTNHKYFRVREIDGKLYFDASANGGIWTNLTSFTNPFDLTNIKIGTAVGTGSTELLTTSAIVDSFNILPAGAATLSYDANGNMINDGKNCSEYNEANQLSKVKNCLNNQTIVEYYYDYNGLRMGKENSTNGTHTNTVISWSDSFETKTIVGGSTENTTYYFANDQLIAKKKPDGTRQYIHTDHLGSTSIITNAAGALVESTKYDPWGEVKSGGTQSKFLFTGQEKDPETGLNYYNSRYYDAHLRRFTQPDDTIQNVYDPQMLNRYSYVRNNPLRYTDPSGNIIPLLGLAVAAVRIAVPIIVTQVPKIIPAITSVATKVSTAVISRVTSTVSSTVTATTTLASSVANAVKTIVTNSSKTNNPPVNTTTTTTAVNNPPVVNATVVNTTSAASTTVTNNTSTVVNNVTSQTSSVRGTQNPFVKQAVQYGQYQHKTYQYGSGYQREVTLDSGKRIDGLNAALKHIKELKPDNPASIRKGEKQLEGYLKELNETRGGGWTGEVVTYPRLVKP